MRVLGIDPGLTRCGVGVVEGETGRPLTLIDVGVVRTSFHEAGGGELLDGGGDARLGQPFAPGDVARRERPLARDREQDRRGRGREVVVIVAAQGAHESSEAMPQMLGDLFGLSILVRHIWSLPGS